MPSSPAASRRDMILYLVRHGQTEWNVLHRTQGHTDVALSRAGREQARRLAGRVASWSLSAVYSSDLVRAAETARLIAARHGLDVVADGRLREMNLGAWEGLGYDELARRFPDERRAWIEDPATCRPSGGELLAETQARMVAAIEAICARHPGPEDRVLVVGHGYAILAYLCHVLGLPLASFRRLWIDPTGLSELRLGGARASVRGLNNTAHLDV